MTEQLKIVFKNKPEHILYLLKFLNEDVVRIIISFYIDFNTCFYVPVKSPYNYVKLNLSIDFIYHINLYYKIDYEKFIKQHDDILICEKENINKTLFDNCEIIYNKINEPIKMFYMLIAANKI